MDGQSIALWSALIGLAAVLLDRRARGASGSGGGLTVRGAEVSIDARNQVESTTVWEWIGPRGDFVWRKGVNRDGGWDSLALTPGQFYDRKIAFTQSLLTEFRPVNGSSIQDPSLWNTYWRPTILTVQQQLDAPVIKVPTPLVS